MAFEVAWWFKGDSTYVECIGEQMSGPQVQVVVRGEELEINDGQRVIKVQAERQQLARQIHWDHKDLEVLITMRLAPRMKQLSGHLHLKRTDQWIGLLCLPR